MMKHLKLLLLTLSVCVFPQILLAQKFAFPLKISPNGRYLTDQQGKPFLYNADTGWRLFFRPTLEEAEMYLENRRQKGFTVIQAQLLSDDENERNLEGQAPLVNLTDLSTPNEAYFKRVEGIIRLAQRQGMVLSIAPAWLGCCQGSWKAILKQNGPEKNRAFGRYIGKRFAKYPNIIWIMGGDRDPGEFKPEVQAMAEGIREMAPRQLITAHAGSPRSAVEEYPEAKWLDINSTYTYSPDIVNVGRPQYHVYAASLNDYNRLPVKPFILLESAYENERNSTPPVIRRQAYWSILSGAAGHALGNLPVYMFEEGWKTAMNAQASQDMARWYQLFTTRNWHLLVPDQGHQWVVDGYGTFDGNPGKNEQHPTGFDFVTAALTSDGKLGIAYIPDKGSRQITLDLARLAGPVQVRWYDPSNGKFQPASVTTLANKGKQLFSVPDRNQGGNGDWVLVAEVKPQ